MSDAKQALRSGASRARAAIPGTEAAHAAREMARRFMAEMSPVSGSVVALYWPVKGELDTRPLMERLTARGIQLALPVVTGTGKPLMFRAWRPGEGLVEGHYGIQVPPEGAAAVRPDIIGVPLLAFDETGHRLGYGGGYYDRTLEALRSDGGPLPLAVGLAFERQRVGWLPRHGGDQVLDRIVTEFGVHRVSHETEQL